MVGLLAVQPADAAANPREYYGHTKYYSDVMWHLPFSRSFYDCLPGYDTAVSR